MYLVDIILLTATSFSLFVTFLFLVMWVCLVRKSRKLRKKVSRRRMERGSPKIYTRRMPQMPSGKCIRDFEMQPLEDGHQTKRSRSGESLNTYFGSKILCKQLTQSTCDSSLALMEFFHGFWDYKDCRIALILGLTKPYPTWVLSHTLSNLSIEHNLIQPHLAEPYQTWALNQTLSNIIQP